MGNGYAYVGNNPGTWSDPLGQTYAKPVYDEDGNYMGCESRSFGSPEVFSPLDFWNEFGCNNLKAFWEQYGISAFQPNGGSGSQTSGRRFPVFGGTGSGGVSGEQANLPVPSAPINKNATGGSAFGDSWTRSISHSGSSDFPMESVLASGNPTNPPPGDPIDCQFHPWHSGCPWNPAPPAIAAMEPGFTNCQWTPMAPGCPLHIVPIIPSAPQCSGRPFFLGNQFVALPQLPNPVGVPDCTHHPPEECLDLPTGGDQPAMSKGAEPQTATSWWRRRGRRRRRRRRHGVWVPIHRSLVNLTHRGRQVLTRIRFMTIAL